MHMGDMRPNNNTIEDEPQPFTCPIASCTMRYSRKGWLTRHITQCHQASEEASTSAQRLQHPRRKAKIGRQQQQRLNSISPSVQRYFQQ